LRATNAAAFGPKKDCVELQTREAEPAEALHRERKPLSLELLLTNATSNEVLRTVSAPTPHVQIDSVSANLRSAWVPNHDSHIKEVTDWSGSTSTHENSRFDKFQPGTSLSKVSQHKAHPCSNYGTNEANAQEQGYHSTTPGQIDLSHIENCIIRAQKVFPELSSPKLESTEDAVLRIIKQYARLSAPMRDSKGRLDSPDMTKTDLYKVKDEPKYAEAKFLAWSTDFEELKMRYDMEKTHLNRTIEKLRHDNTELVSSHNTKLNTERSSIHQETEGLQIMYEGRLMKARDDAASQAKLINNLESQIEQQMTQYRAHEKTFEEAKSSLGKRLKAERSEHRNRLKEAEEASIARLHRERENYEEMVRTLEIRMKAEQSEHESCLKGGEEMSERRLHQEGSKYEKLLNSLESRLAQLKKQSEKSCSRRRTNLRKSTKSIGGSSWRSTKKRPRSSIQFRNPSKATSQNIEIFWKNAPRISRRT
jgi:hypothetical protein